MDKLKVETVTAKPGETMAQAVFRCIGPDAVPRFVRTPLSFERDYGQVKYEVHYLTRKPLGIIHEC